jgi:hypothetical protein
MSLIYEVNLQISSAKVKDYLAWLQRFVDGML